MSPIYNPSPTPNAGQITGFVAGAGITLTQGASTLAIAETFPYFAARLAADDAGVNGTGLSPVLTIGGTFGGTIYFFHFYCFWTAAGNGIRIAVDFPARLAVNNLRACGVVYNTTTDVAAAMTIITAENAVVSGGALGTHWAEIFGTVEVSGWTNGGSIRLKYAQSAQVDGDLTIMQRGTWGYAVQMA